MDESKSHWGLSGFSTHDINRCQTTARPARWSATVELALPCGAPTARMEAITSLPLLLAAMGKAASYAGRTTLYLTPLHGKGPTLASLGAELKLRSASSAS